MATPVSLNVGGTQFTTSLEALQSDPNSMLAAMFSGRHALDEVPFVDRDPTHFGTVLNFLRDGTAPLPEGAAEREELLREAEFFQVTALLAALQGRQGRDLALGAHNVALRDEEDAVRAQFLPPGGPPPRAGAGEWFCAACTLRNEDQAECSACGTPAPVARGGGDWAVAPDAGMDYVLDVFEPATRASFAFEDLSSPQMPVLLAPAPERRADGARVCEDLPTFERQFAALTRGVLRGLDWGNVVCAGGAVLGALLPVADAAAALDERALTEYLNIAEEHWEVPAGEEDPTDMPHAGFRGSDIDLFLHGLDEAAAMAKIEHIHAIVARNAGHRNVMVVRTRRTVTLAPGWPLRNVQIILRLYSNPAEVLLGFDLDCVGVGYDGRRVLALPRARRAINSRCNVADPTRTTYRTSSYEQRLFKYASRGFGVVVPCFARERVDASIFVRPYSELSGLAKLLFLEARVRQLETADVKQARARTLGYRVSRDGVDAASLAEEDAGMEVSAYNDGVLVPFGPNISWYSIRRRLDKKVRDAGGPVAFVHGRYDEAMVHALPPTRTRVPQRAHFVGSLGEYVASLEAGVEDDWFRDAYV